MIFSKYNFEVSDGDLHLMFNSRTGNCIIISNNEYNNFLSFTSSEENQDNYASLGFYVNENFNEFQEIQQNCKKKTTNSHINKYRILTTTGCNAKCFYCYEQGIKHYSMNSETAIKVAEFIINHIGQRNTIQIEWFGGEPLLNIPAIELITNYIYTNKPDYVSYRSSIITNASKINETLVSKMSNDWFTTRVQITIDGVGSVYEKIKQLGKGSFEHVIESIGLLVNNGIQVDIRLNFNNKNTHLYTLMYQYQNLCLDTYTKI